jgi:ligand-binding SRPBCC domain-containing protein
MKVYQLIREQQLNTSIEEAWDFFSSAKNLKLITPDYMDFKITSISGEGKVYPGQIITYLVRPLAGIQLNWATEITEVKAPFYFVDKQLAGPYEIWHHQHHFTQNDHGVMMQDIVTYAIPWYALGNLGNKLIISKKLDQIFDYRYNVIDELFNEKQKVGTVPV